MSRPLIKGKSIWESDYCLVAENLIQVGCIFWVDLYKNNWNNGCARTCHPIWRTDHHLIQIKTNRMPPSRSKPTHFPMSLKAPLFSLKDEIAKVLLFLQMTQGTSPKIPLKPVDWSISSKQSSNYILLICYSCYGKNDGRNNKESEVIRSLKASIKRNM